jgi:hypothetical protein
VAQITTWKYILLTAMISLSETILYSSFSLSPRIRMQVFTLLVVLFVSGTLAHPGKHEPTLGSDLQKRSQMAKRCTSATAAMKQKRYNKRTLQKKRDIETHNTTFQITTEAPYYEVLQNDTCVLAPTVTEGPVSTIIITRA